MRTSAMAIKPIPRPAMVPTPVYPVNIPTAIPSIKQPTKMIPPAESFLLLFSMISTYKLSSIKGTNNIVKINVTFFKIGKIVCN